MIAGVRPQTSLSSPTSTGEFWGVVAYFNPARSSCHVQNLQRFSAGVRNQGLKLLIVELAFHDAPFAVADEWGDVVLRRRSQSLLWQKERLLNLGFQALPPECDKVAWLDGDLVFENANWVAEAAHRLDFCPVLQLFQSACWLPRDEFELFGECPAGFGEGHCMPGIAYQLSTHPDRRRALGDFFQHGHTGFAWAARRSLLNTCGLYDRSIIGGGDVDIAHAFFGDEDYFRCRNPHSRRMSKSHIQSITQWGRSLGLADGSVGYVPGRVLHLYHGGLSGRSYGERMQILKENDYDPHADVAVDEDGCLRWNSDKSALHRSVAEYFSARVASNV